MKSKTTLIRPPAVSAKWVPGLIATPPLAHAYLAGMLTHHGYPVDVIDGLGEAIDQKTILNDTFAIYGLTTEQIVDRIDPETRVIGVSAMFTQGWPHMRVLLRAIRERFPNAVVCCGGEHISAEPDFSLRDVPEFDICVLGEGEGVLLDIVRAVSEGKPWQDIPGIAYLKEGRVIRTMNRPRIADIDSIPWPRWEGIPVEAYMDRGLGFGVNRGRSMPMLATRGCPYRCTFCSSPQMWTTKWRARQPEDVIREIETYIERYGATNFDFYDLTAIVHKKWLVDFSKLIIEKNLNITWQLPSGTRTEAIDYEACKYLYDSGCRNITYAPESGSPEILEKIKKRIKLETMVTSMRQAVAAGLNVKFNIILGFPGETHRDVFKSMKFVIQGAVAGAHDFAIWLFSPYPGSELFKQLEHKITRNDEFFVALAAYSDFSKAVSWNPGMSARTLKMYRYFIMAMFYGISYAMRPVRVLRTIKHLWTGKHESRLESILAAMWERLRQPATSYASS